MTADGSMPGYGRPLRQWPDVESMLRHVETMRARNDEVLAAFAAAREEAGDLGSEGFSEDGLVRAEIDDAGSVTKLEFDERAMRALSQLGRSMVTAIHEAQAAHALKMAELAGRVETTINVGSMVADAIPAHMRESIERRDGKRW